MHRLPPELLCRVFEACNAHWDARAPSSTIGPYTWLRVTHVCAHWRAVALASPLLWSHIVLVRSAPCVEAMLARSQQTPLTVQTCARTDAAFPLRALRLALQHIHRVRALELACKWWVFDDVAAALARPAPLLERVSLSTPSGLPDAGPVLPVLALASAQLTELTLVSYGFPWHTPMPLHNLRRLHITHDILKPSISSVLAALALLPALSSLHLSDVLAPLAALPAPGPTVHLPALADLVLAGDCLACTALFAALRLPRTCAATLDFRSARAAGNLALALAALVPASCELTLHTPHAAPCDGASSA